MKVRDRADRIDAAGGRAVFVVHDEPDRIRESMLAGLDVVFPVLVDLDRQAYRAWGLRRAKWTTVYLDPSVWGSYARKLLAGERLPKGGRDTLQLGGDFVVAPDGTLAYARPQEADARPPVGELLTALERAAGTR